MDSETVNTTEVPCTSSDLFNDNNSEISVIKSTTEIPEIWNIVWYVNVGITDNDLSFI